MMGTALGNQTRCRWIVAWSLLSALTSACGDSAPTGTPDAGPADVPADVPADTAQDVVVDAGPPRVVQVSLNSIGHTCAVLSDGAVRCWGLDDNGQLGVEPSSARDSCRLTSGGSTVTQPCEQRPREVQGVTGATAVAVGNGTSCALKGDGSVWCWGLNDAGELGQGTSDLRAHPTPARVTLPMAATELSLGAFHACARLSDGTVACWGSNKFGQVGLSLGATTGRCDEGDGTLSPCVTTPAVVPGVSGVRQLSLGRNHTCALRTDGTVWCWGLNRSGQVGSGMIEADPRQPTMVPGLTGVTALGAGGSHSCAVLTDGTARCWGWNGLGQLGVPPSRSTACMTPAGSTLPCALTPTAVPGLTGVQRVALGRYHTCAVLTDGAVQCWGRNDEGQVGVAAASTERCSDPPDVYPCEPSPSRVTPLAAGSVGVGDYHTCAVTRDGEARCWGTNVFGQLGDGTTTSRRTPTAVSGLP